MHYFPFLCWIKFCSGYFRHVFLILVQKKWLLVTFNRWSSYSVTDVWKLGSADPALVLLDEWLSYRGGCISRFDIYNLCNKMRCVPIFYKIFINNVLLLPFGNSQYNLLA